MTMTITEMRDFVRTHADATTTDAPDSSLDVYARIAYNDIHTRTNFPMLQSKYTFTTVANQQDYLFTSIAPGDLDKVTSIIDTTNLGRRLIFMARSDADLAFGAPIGATSQIATAFTVENGVISLFPKPSVSGVSYTVRGLRAPTAWPGAAGSSPDLPAVLHEAIAWFMLSSYYMSQEDVNLAGVYLQEYEQMVNKFVRSESFRDFGQRNGIMGGQNYFLPTFGRWVRGMVE